MSGSPPSLPPFWHVIRPARKLADGLGREGFKVWIDEQRLITVAAASSGSGHSYLACPPSSSPSASHSGVRDLGKRALAGSRFGNTALDHLLSHFEPPAVL